MNITINTDQASPLLLRALAREMLLEVDEISADDVLHAAELEVTTAKPPATQPAAAPPATEPAAAPPPATEPAATSPATAPADVELDSEGLPWDARIHSREKTRVKKDNTWRVKRGSDPAVVAQVKAELRAKYPAPGTTTAAAPPVAAPPATEPAAAPPPATEPAATPPPAGDHPAANMTFPVFLQTCRDAGFGPDQIQAACQTVGLGSTAMLGTDPAKIPLVYDQLFPSA